MTNYLVTGSTGAVGSALVPVLLESPGHRVVLLIRAGDDDALARRLDGLFDFWRLGLDETEARKRIVAVRGDATMPRLGLDPQEYAKLADTVDSIIHCAGAVRMNLSIKSARLSAVGSAQEVLRLARLIARNGTLQKIEVVSTVGVGGRLTSLPETWVDRPRQYHNTYEQAKAEAEILLRDAIDEGLPVTVHRPSMIVGDSRDGRTIHFQIFYHLCDFLSGRRTAGFFPPLGDLRLDIVPSDFVARALAWSSTQPGLAGQVIHECAGDQGSIPLTDLRQHVRAMLDNQGAGVPIQVTVPRVVFVAALRAIQLFVDERSRRAINTLPIFLDYLNTSHDFANRSSQATLAGAGIACPAWETYLDRVLRPYLFGR